MTGRVTGAGLVGVVVLSLLSGCGGGDGGGSTERPTGSVTFSPTRELPRPTRTPSRTSRPREQPSAGPTDRPTEEPTEQPPTTAAPGPTGDASATPSAETSASSIPEISESSATSRPPETPSSAVATPEGTPSGAESSGAAESADEGVPPWVWWLVGGLVVLLGILTWFGVARGRRRRAWEERLHAAEAEVAWLARELLPQLRATGSLEQVAGGWTVARPRVSAAEDQLTVLESSAHGEASTARARVLRDAVRESRALVERLRGGDHHDAWILDLDGAIALLESVLAPTSRAAGPPP
jgi:hypothetical protein